eukprot:403359011
MNSQQISNDQESDFFIEEQEEIISQRKICYYSNFDINVNEWFEEFENIQIFKHNVQKNLGNLWVQYFIFGDKQAQEDLNEVSCQHLQVLLECFLLEVPQVPSEIDSQIQSNKDVTYQQEITSSLTGAVPLKKQESSGQLLSSNQRFNEHLKFEQFFDIALLWFTTSKSHSPCYEIIDQQTFKSLLHTFYFVAMKEMSNITKKRVSDERFAIAQLTEKALARHNNKKIASRGSWSSNLTSASLQTQTTAATANLAQPYFNQSNVKNSQKEQIPNGRTGKQAETQQQIQPQVGNKWGRAQMSSLIPGFSIIKNKVITPLLVATERVVDYIISEDKQQTNANKQDIRKSEGTSSICDDDSLPDSFKQLSICDSEQRRRKLKRRSHQLLREDDAQTEKELNENQSYQNLLSKASDCIDLIQKRRRVNDSVTSIFVTNIIEINNDALNQLKSSPAMQQDQEEEKMQIENSQQNDEIKQNSIIESNPDVNIRFIKPSKNFYNQLMGLWLRFDKSRLNQVTFDEFLAYIKKHSLIGRDIANSNDSAQQLAPTQHFFQTLKNEWLKMQQLPNELSISHFFNQVKSKLFQKWNEQIINKSKQFNKTQSQLASSPREE